MEKKTTLRTLLIGLSVATSVLGMEQATNATTCCQFYEGTDSTGTLLSGTSNLVTAAEGVAEGDTAFCKVCNSNPANQHKGKWTHITHCNDSWHNQKIAQTLIAAAQKESPKIPGWSSVPDCS